MQQDVQRNPGGLRGSGGKIFRGPIDNYFILSNSEKKTPTMKNYSFNNGHYRENVEKELEKKNRGDSKQASILRHLIQSNLILKSYYNS